MTKRQLINEQMSLSNFLLFKVTNNMFSQDAILWAMKPEKKTNGGKVEITKMTDADWNKGRKKQMW